MFYGLHTLLVIFVITDLLRFVNTILFFTFYLSFFPSFLFSCFLLCLFYFFFYYCGNYTFYFQSFVRYYPYTHIYQILLCIFKLKKFKLVICFYFSQTRCRLEKVQAPQVVDLSVTSGLLYYVSVILGCEHMLCVYSIWEF